MNLTIEPSKSRRPTFRPGTLSDARACGEICYRAFFTIAPQHHFPPEDFPSAEMMEGILSRRDVYSVVAEAGGRIIGSNFLWEWNSIAGVGPITIDPDSQNGGVARRLMEAIFERASERKFPGVLLVQAAYHGRSLSLYAKLGFEVREPLANMQGAPIGDRIDGYPVRRARLADIETCDRLCRRIQGHDRSSELRNAIKDCGPRHSWSETEASPGKCYAPN